MEDKKSPMKIPVKKSDGTTVFLTMDEFKEYKKNSASFAAPASAPAPVPVPAPSAPVVPPIPPAPTPVVPEPPVEKPHAAPRTPKKLEQGKVETISMPDPVPLPAVQKTTDVAVSTPVTDIFVDEAKSQAPKAAAAFAAPLPPPPKLASPQQQWKSTDHESLLEADVTKEKKSLPAPAPKPLADSAEAILAKVKEQFPVEIKKEIQGRFDSLVLSRIRDVRSVIDFEQYAKQSIETGGLGFEEDQVGLLLAVIGAAQRIVSPEKKIEKSRPLPPNPPAPLASAPETPKVTPITITPVMSSAPKPAANPFPLPREEYSFSPPPKSQTSRPIVQDVTGPTNKKQTMGPVDEIQYFSLTDFRRLSPKVENAKEILKGKFQSLQEESYVLFLDARDAWHESPLFRMYEETILTALQDKKVLSDALSQKPDGLTQAELDSLVEINHYLG